MSSHSAVVPAGMTHSAVVNGKSEVNCEEHSNKCMLDILCSLHTLYAYYTLYNSMTVCYVYAIVCICICIYENCGEGRVAVHQATAAINI